MSEKSPYLDARREWEERYGNFVSSAHTWKIAAFISLLIALVATVGAIYLATQKTVTPYIVEVDKLGAIVQVKRADTPDQETIQKIIISQLATFVEKARDVVLDARLQRQNVLDAYVFIKKNTPAHTKLTDFYKKNDPFERAQTETVYIEIINVLSLKDNAYHVEWKETVMDRQSGQTQKVNNYKLITYITLATPNDVASIIKNPIGLIINDFNWSKEI